MRKKSGYTLVEGLISMLIISIIGLSAMHFAGMYFKDTYERDRQIKAFISNMSVIERVKAEVKTLPQLYAIMQVYDIKVIAIGVGEVELVESAGNIEISVVSNENYGFSDKLKSGEMNLFRIEVGSNGLPNTKLITILRLEGESGG